MGAYVWPYAYRLFAATWRWAVARCSVSCLDTDSGQHFRHRRQASLFVSEHEFTQTDSMKILANGS